MARKTFGSKEGFTFLAMQRTSPMALAIFAHAARGKDRDASSFGG